MQPITALFALHTCAPFFNKTLCLNCDHVLNYHLSWLNFSWNISLLDSKNNVMTELSYTRSSTGPGECGGSLVTWPSSLFLFMGILRTLTWGGVLLIPRSADEWKEGQTHMHVRLASIHSLTSSGGVNTKPTRGRPDSLPDSDMHCLPVNPTTKRYFVSLEGLMLVTSKFSLICNIFFKVKKETREKKKSIESIQVMQHKMADTMLLWGKKANKYW